MLSRKRSVPDHWRRALRLSIAVFLPISLGYGLMLPEKLSYSKSFAQGCKWSAMAAVVVTFPLISKVGQVSAERSLGTILGGLLGFTVHYVGSMFWSEYSDGIFLSIIAALVACASVIVGNALSLDLSAKLFTLTFILVTCGAVEGKDPLKLTISRTTGIVGGVLLMLLLTVLILPKSATMECIHNLEKALDSMSKLNRLAWRKYLPDTVVQGGAAGAPGALPPKRQRDASLESRVGYEVLPSQEPVPQLAGGHAASAHALPAALKAGSSHSGGSADAKAAYEQYEQECEKVLTEIYQALFKLQENMELAKTEVLACTCGGHMILLPGLPLVKTVTSKHMPWDDMEGMATTIRRVARLLITLISSMEQDFETDMKAILSGHYPEGLMEQLAQASQGAIQAMCESFPQEAACGADCLAHLTKAVSVLVSVSDHQRQRIVRALRGNRKRRFARDAWQRLINTVRAQGSTGPDAAPEEPQSPQSLSAPTSPLMRRFPANADVAFSRAEAGLIPAPSRGSQRAPSRLFQSSFSPSMGCAPAAGGDLGPAPTDAAALEAMAAQLQRDLEGNGSAAASRTTSEAAEGMGAVAGPGGVAGASVGAGAALGGPGPAGTEGPALGAGVSLRRVGEKLLRVQVQQQQQQRQRHGGRQQQEQQQGEGEEQAPSGGSPLSQSLPTGGLTGAPDLARVLKPLSSSEADMLLEGEGSGEGLGQGRRVCFPAGRCDTMQQAMFPETAAGQVAQVRWYSFQFMMEELVDEMAELHAALCKTLSKLP